MTSTEMCSPSILSARSHKPNIPHAVNCVWKHYCNAFLWFPVHLWNSACWYYHRGDGGRCVRGCSVYSAPFAWLPACLLIALYSECLRPMWGVAAGSIGCNVTKHIRDGYSRLVKARRSIQTPFCLSALLSSPFCAARLSLCLCLFRLLCLCLLASFLLISSCLNSLLSCLASSQLSVYS